MLSSCFLHASSGSTASGGSVSSSSLVSLTACCYASLTALLVLLRCQAHPLVTQPRCQARSDVFASGLNSQNASYLACLHTMPPLLQSLMMHPATMGRIHGDSEQFGTISI